MCLSVKDSQDPPRYKSYLCNSVINWEDLPACTRQEGQCSLYFVKERQLPCLAIVDESSFPS